MIHDAIDELLNVLIQKRRLFSQAIQCATRQRLDLSYELVKRQLFTFNETKVKMTLKCRLLFVDDFSEVKTIISDLYLELARDIQLAHKQSDLEVMCYMEKKACGFIR